MGLEYRQHTTPSIQAHPCDRLPRKLYCACAYARCQAQRSNDECSHLSFIAGDRGGLTLLNIYLNTAWSVVNSSDENRRSVVWGRDLFFSIKSRKNEDEVFVLSFSQRMLV